MAVAKHKTYVPAMDIHYVASHDGMGTVCRLTGSIDEAGEACLRVTPLSKTQSIGNGAGVAFNFYDYTELREYYKPFCVAEWIPIKKQTLFTKFIDNVKRVIRKLK